jgi:hypothetical protein
MFKLPSQNFTSVVLAPIIARASDIMLFLLRAVRIRAFTITDSNTLSRVAPKLINGAAAVVDGVNPRGLIIGWMYIGVSSWAQFERSITLLTTESKYRELTEYASVVRFASSNAADDTATDTTSAAKITTMCRKIITVCERFGGYGSFTYRFRELDVSAVTPLPRQAAAIEQITGHFRTHGNSTVILHGAPGTGKSVCALALSAALGGRLCRTFCPTDPGDYPGIMYAAANAASEPGAAAFVVVLEEFDVILTKITTGTVIQHKLAPAAVSDKTTWNAFLDDIVSNMYPGIVLIMTTNKTPEQLRSEYDPALTRPGRIGVVIEMAAE